MANSNRTAVRAALGAGTAVSAFIGLLLGQGQWARRTIGSSKARPPLPRGTINADVAGAPVACVILGDSAAVGFGMTSVDATPPGMIGLGLAHLLDCPVTVTSVAAVGARTADLDEQITAALAAEPDIALIIIGTNDVTNRVRPAVSARLLAGAVRRLRTADCDVVVGTCPDLGTVKPLPQPLRTVARIWSQRLAAKQAVATLHAGGRVVSLGGLLGPLFGTDADRMFGTDHFHPSETGYAHMVSVVIPSLAAALRERNIDAWYATESAPPRDLLPIAQAATQAAQQAGTELVRTGRWATLRRRRRAYN